MSRRLLQGSLLILCTLAVSPLRGAEADYPQFRGPNRDGLSSDKNLLTQWPEGGPKLVWKADNLGVGFSSVAVAGERVFTMGDVDRDGCFLFAIERTSGKQLWSLKVGRTGGNYRGPRSTPTVDDDRVYALGQYGDLVCVEAKSGKEIWRKSYVTDFKGRSGGWNYTESVLIDGDALICTPGGRAATIVALNKMSGATIWKCAVEDDGAAYSSPVVAEVGGIRHYVTLLRNNVIGVRAKDGELLWRYGRNRFGGNTANIPTCIVKDNFVFCTAGYGRGGGLVKLTAKDGGLEAEEVYFNRSLTNKHGGVILIGDHLYGDRDSSGRPWCADFKTGKVAWSKTQRTKGSGSASVTFADGRLYVRYSNGWVALVDASPESYTEKSTFKIPNGNRDCWSHPVVVGGRLYLREQGTLWCYEVSK